MATFLELYGDRLDTELGSADNTVLFTLARRKAAINLGQREFARLTHCFRRETTIALVDDQQEYDLEALITNGDFLGLDKQGLEICLTPATGDPSYISGDAFTYTTIKDLNRYDPGWRGADASDPAQWYLHESEGKTYLGLHPKPDIAAGATAVLTVPYHALPGDLSNPASIPFAVSADSYLTLVPYHQALVHYAAAQLEKLRRDWDAVRLQEQRFSAYVDQYKAAHQPIGGQRVRFARDYRRERSHAENPLLLDPRR